MRRLSHTLLGSLTVIAAAAVLAPTTGCSTLADDCVDGQCWSGANGAGTGGAAGAGGAGGGTPCDPNTTPYDGGCASDERGIFVRNEGDDGNSGTREQPLKTLSAAVALASSSGKHRVFACAQSFAEQVSVPPGVELYGGLDCATDWSWTDTKTTVAPSASGAVPLRLLGGPTAPNVVVADVAALAPAADTPGHSSIAVITDQIVAELHRCSLTAGRGADGAVGASEGAPAAAGPTGNPGSNGHCNSGPAVSGGAAKVNPACTSTQGGSGGDGGVSSGVAGSPGSQATGVPNPSGLGGPGQPSSGSWNCPASSMDGRAGIAGDAGAGATSMGFISASGYAGPQAEDGTSGSVGRGGGGGGGGKQALSCQITGIGPGGGSGGPGGCAGVGGGGGGAGGSSFALLSIESWLTLSDTSLTSGDGGRGGDGGVGQAGGAGGPGGAGGTGGCSGGNGGAGGPGGPGGGGLGGHSIAIAYVGTAPERQGDTATSIGAAGSGGLDGEGSTTNAGGDGIAVAEQIF